MRPVRIQRSRILKQISPNGLPIVYVGRPSKWGNPYRVKDNFPEKAVIHTREAAMELFTIYANKQVEINPNWLDELTGKNLSCWCGEDEMCHADILLDMANRPR